MDNINAQTAFELFFANSNDLLMIVDSDCRIVKINKICQRVFGYEQDEIVGKSIVEFIHNDDMDRALQQFQRLLDSPGQTLQFKNKATNRDGSTRWIQWTTCVEDGVLYSTGVDVTRLEENLRNVANFRRQYISREESDIGLWEYVLETQEFIGDERVYNIFGLPFKISQPIENLRCIVPLESQEIVNAHIESVIQSKMFENFECEIIRPTDNTKRVLSVKGNFIMDENFTVKSFFGTIQDITEQKEIMRQYDQLSKLQSTMLAALEPLVALYSDGAIKWANKREMLGYTLEYMKDKPISCVFKNYDDYVRIKAEAYKSMSMGNRYSIDFEAATRDGGTAWIHLSGKRMTPQSVIWTAIDVTDQKNAAMSIAKNHALLKDTQRAAQIGCWETTVNDPHTIMLDEVACKIIDIDSEEEKMHISTALRLIGEVGRKNMHSNIRVMAPGSTFISFDSFIQTQKGNTKHIIITGDILKESKRIVGIVQDITKIEQLEHELEEKRRRIDAIYATSPTAIGLIHGYNIFDCNNEFYKITGYQADELFDKGLRRIMSPSEIERLKRKSQQSGDNATVHSFETVFLRKTGRKVNVLLNFSIFETDDKKQRSSIISVTDITALKIAQQTNYQLIESINQSQSEFIIYDSNWIAVYANDKVFIAHNLKSEDIIGQRIKEFDLDNKQQKILYQKLMETGSVNGEFQVRNTDVTWYSVRISPIFDRNKQITGYVSVKENITARKNIEMELMKALSKAEQSDRMKETLLQNLSHEVRTPLNAISGFAEIISESVGLPEETLKSYTNIISNSCNQLLGIVSDMLVMSDIQLGQVSVAVSRIIPDEMLKRLFRIFLQQAQSKNINLEYAEPTDKSVVIYSDETKLGQILTNLLTNAIKFTDEGGVTFGFTTSEKQIKFYVRDTGIGISDENKRMIFDRFFQVTTNKASSYGTGLGLAISQSFAKMLKGQITVESELGKGATFYLTIPIKD